MKTCLLIFPNQLFQDHPGFAANPDEVVLIEDTLFFGDARYPARFHKQKLWLHRASMKRYERFLQQQNICTRYVEYDRATPTHHVLQTLGHEARYVTTEPDDFILEKRLRRFAEQANVEIEFLSNPQFINRPSENVEYRRGKKRWFMADFYKFQRKRLDVMMDGDEPVGGKWSFDADNRKKIPKRLLGQLPTLPSVTFDGVDEAARDYVQRRFPDNLGSIEQLYYPTSHDAAERWLMTFLQERFALFGDYEDAIVAGETWLWHSVLTPMLNVGLLTPQQIVDAALHYATSHDVPLNSLEGFLRQIIGWREFMRATYDDLGVRMRRSNHWNHHRKIPSSFYDGTTGILPVDDTIRRLLDTGYCHHIERLMVLGGFMFLCEFDAREIYRWFMEMFVDSYDWVMVPNVYAMSQNADGGLITTKPYFSGSAYIRKMSNYTRSDSKRRDGNVQSDVANWCDVWDGLYWRWIWNHTDELRKNPRWAMMCRAVEKMDVDRRETHLRHAERFLNQL